jgi:hypothetical protein
LIPKCRFTHGDGSDCVHDENNTCITRIHIYSIEELSLKHQQISKITPWREGNTVINTNGMFHSDKHGFNVHLVHESVLVLPCMYDTVLFIHLDTGTSRKYNHSCIMNIYSGHTIQHSRIVLRNTRTDEFEAYRFLDLLHNNDDSNNDVNLDNKQNLQFIIPTQLRPRLYEKTNEFNKVSNDCFWLNSSQLAIIIVVTPINDNTRKIVDYYLVQVVDHHDEENNDDNTYDRHYRIKKVEVETDQKQKQKQKQNNKNLIVIQHSLFMLENIASPCWITIVYPPDPWIVSLSYWITFALSASSISNNNLMILIASYLL